MHLLKPHNNSFRKYATRLPIPWAVWIHQIHTAGGVGGLATIVVVFVVCSCCVLQSHLVSSLAVHKKVPKDNPKVGTFCSTHLCTILLCKLETSLLTPMQHLSGQCFFKTRCTMKVEKHNIEVECPLIVIWCETHPMIYDQ